MLSREKKEEILDIVATDIMEELGLENTEGNKIETLIKLREQALAKMDEGLANDIKIYTTKIILKRNEYKG